MRLCFSTAALVSVALAMPGAPANAQTTPQSRPQARAQARPARQSHLRVSVNAGIQPASSSFDVSTPKLVAIETTSVHTAYHVNEGQFFDAGVAFTMSRGFGVGVAVSRFSKDGDATIDAGAPHPFFFETLRPISGTSGARREELATHVQILYAARPGRLEVVASAGRSFYSVKQDFVSDISYNETYPYDSATFAGATLVRQSRRKTGYNVGVDVGLRLARSVGVGAVVRFSKASLDMTVPNVGAPVRIDAGGLQAGGGLRLYF